jgi:hypothetical protein
MQCELMRYRELLVAANGNPFSDSPIIQIKGKRRKFSNSQILDKRKERFLAAGLIILK